LGPTYTDTFIEVADDCPVAAAEVPQPHAGRATKALIEYQLLAEHPYGYTGEEIQWLAHVSHKGIPEADWPAERERFRPHEQPCLRASALGKRYGWGTHHDGAGRVALVARQSERYAWLADDEGLRHLRAMRSSRH
jgi:hypothetical protein